MKSTRQRDVTTGRARDRPTIAGGTVDRRRHQPVVGKGQEAQAPEEVVQEAVLLQAYQTGSRGGGESTPGGNDLINTASSRVKRTLFYFCKSEKTSWVPCSFV